MDVEDIKLAIDMATVRNMNGAPLRRRGIAIFRMYERIHLNKVEIQIPRARWRINKKLKTNERGFVSTGQRRSVTGLGDCDTEYRYVTGEW